MHKAVMVPPSLESVADATPEPAAGSVGVPQSCSIPWGRSRLLHRIAPPNPVAFPIVETDPGRLLEADTANAVFDRQL